MGTSPVESLPKEVQAFLFSDPSWSANTRRTYQFNLTSYVRWNGGPGISKETFLHFLADLEKKGRASGGRRSVGQTLRAYASFLDLNTSKWKIPKGRSRQKLPLTDEEFNRLLSGVGKQNHARDTFMLQALRHSGLRVSEFLAAKWSHLDLRKGEWFVPKGKGEKARTIVLTDEGKGVMVNWWCMVDSSRGLEETRDVEERICGLSPRGVQMVIQRAARRAGLQTRGLSTHSLRHTFVTGLLRAGASIETARRQAGHANLATTSGYSKFVEADVRRDLERVGLRRE